MPIKSLLQETATSCSPADSARPDAAQAQRKLKERMLSCLEKDRIEENGMQTAPPLPVVLPSSIKMADSEDAVICQSFIICQRIARLVGTKSPP